jgi:uncharacterized membrane protein
MDSAAQYALAYALTTSAGIRALLPLALVSIAVHLGYVHMPASFAWLGSTTVTAILIGMAVLEVFADKVPILDHTLHVLQVVTKPAAAAILVGGVTHPQSREVLFGLMAIGALNALGIHAFTSSFRVVSTATTGGIGNPFISAFEDMTSAGVVLLAFVVPFIAAALSLCVAIVLFRMGRSAYRKTRVRRRT